MKKLKKLKLIILVLCLGIVSSAICQEENDIFTRHEISIGHGVFPSTSHSFPHYKNYNFSKGDYIGSFYVAYTYKFNKVIGIGATFAYDPNYYSIENTDKQTISRVRENVFSGVFHLKINWVRTKLVTMYSKVGMGFFYPATKIENFQPDTYEITEGETDFSVVMFSAVPVGIEIGTKQYAGFLQVGYGMEGLFSIGFRYGIHKTYKK